MKVRYKCSRHYRGPGGYSGSRPAVCVSQHTLILGETPKIVMEGLERFMDQPAPREPEPGQPVDASTDEDYKPPDLCREKPLSWSEFPYPKTVSRVGADGGRRRAESGPEAQSRVGLHPTGLTTSVGDRKTGMHCGVQASIVERTPDRNPPGHRRGNRRDRRKKSGLGLEKTIGQEVPQKADEIQSYPIPTHSIGNTKRQQITFA